MALFGTLDPWRDAGALFLPTMLLLMGEANMYQKFFSAKDERAARRLRHRLDHRHDRRRDVDCRASASSAASCIPGLSTGDSEAIVIRVAGELLPLCSAGSCYAARPRSSSRPPTASC